MKVDIIQGLSYGDEGKGKITHSLLSQHPYSAVVRFSGAHNCGHTMIHNGQKVITHAIPAGVLYGVKSIIGPGCCISPKKLFEEIADLETAGIEVHPHLKIARKAHIITDAHLEEDSKDVRIGTTRTGSGPAFREKYGRTGIQAHEIPELQEYLVDFVDEVFTHEEVLFEGAQGTFLDIIHGDYPFVTSSHCTVAGALLNGIPPQAVRKVYGIIKAYETYVGAKEFQPQGNIFNQIREVGGEYGATTGRPRQCNYLNIDQLKRAVAINGVTDLVINKMDILQQLGVWRARNNADEVIDAVDEEGFKSFLKFHLPAVNNFYFSYSPDEI